jgi:hypothetical protein
MGNGVLFNFAFHKISLKHCAEKIWYLSGLFCATPRKYCIFISTKQVNELLITAIKICGVGSKKRKQTIWQYFYGKAEP